MFRDCKNVAISSHVLQKNGILKEISENNHLIELKPSDPFKMESEGISEFRSVGINNVYTFPGFCLMHDTTLFKVIESTSSLNLENKNQQSLFAYRGLCQEIRRKELAKETVAELKTKFPIPMQYLVQSLLDGYSDGIKNLNFFKQAFEDCIRSNNYDAFFLKRLKYPKLMFAFRFH